MTQEHVCVHANSVERTINIYTQNTNGLQTVRELQKCMSLSYLEFFYELSNVSLSVLEKYPLKLEK